MMGANPQKNKSIHESEYFGKKSFEFKSFTYKKVI